MLSCGERAISSEVITEFEAPTTPSPAVESGGTVGADVDDGWLGATTVVEAGPGAERVRMRV